MTINKSKIWGTLGAIVLAFTTLFFGSNTVRDEVKLGFSTVRGFATLESTTANDLTYDFGVVDIPTERVGAASSSAAPSGYEFGHRLPTSATAFTIASTSTGFAVTMNGSGRVKGCSFSLQTIPTTGTVSVMIQKNGTLQSGKYCKLPISGTFATNGGLDDLTRTEAIGASDITFVTGDRFGLIASSSNLNAATVDGWAELLIQLDN